MMKSWLKQMPGWSMLAATIHLGSLLDQPAPTELIYRHAASASLKLYYFKAHREMPEHKTPAALWIHGGGWTGGTCETFFPMARYTATRGAASFVVQYRLVQPGVASVADSIADCKSAVRYLRQHADELGIDPQKIAVIGESAGGHLAACVGMLEQENNPQDDLSLSARPDALVLYNPLTDFTVSTFLNSIFNVHGSTEDKLPQARELSPIYHVRPGLPPTLVCMGWQTR